MYTCDPITRKVIEDVREEAYLEKQDSHRRELAQALTHRCLTAKEMAQVTAMGKELFVPYATPYYEEDVRSRFNAALQTQQILRMKCPKP
jgi:hypothetical protein